MSDHGSPLSGVDVTPTAAEVRACRISLGAEALVRLRAGMSCPHCGEIHIPQVAILMKLIGEGWNALHEAAMASRDALKKAKEAK